MTRIADLLAAGRTFSFEFFPPKTDEGDRQLRQALDELEPLGPSFVSVTYGAGGSTRERTHQIVVDILRNTSMTPMAHLTSVDHTRDELRTILTRYRDAGVENILCLKGDPPRGVDPADVVEEITHAGELVELTHEVGEGAFSIGVAAHAEGHPANPDVAADRRHLAAKLARADFGITNLFFEARHYVRMVEELAELGCDTPVLPGIMPITNVGQIERMAQMSGASVPDDLRERLHAIADDQPEVRRVGVELATRLCDDLLEAGAPGLHFYTLNRSTATREIHANLGLTPTP
ncbi:MAG TPA: methylenetetrahydrofolate reductase [Nitriliruptorales bacterium]